MIEFAVAAGALLCAIPVLLLMVTALKSDAEIIHFSTVFPVHPTLANFRTIVGDPEEAPVLRWFVNSLFISSSITLLVLTVSALAAYAFARLPLPGKRVIFAVIVGTLMVPGQVLLVPVYLILNRLGFIDTPWALIVPAGAGAFGFYLLHQFFLGIPKDLEEASELDGCSRMGTFINVILPLAKPALATLAIFVFVGSWNDFLGPMVFIDSLDRYTLPMGVALFQGSYINQYGLTLAVCVLCTVPVLVAFLLFQRNIIEGISLTGLKD